MRGFEERVHILRSNIKVVIGSLGLVFLSLKSAQAYKTYIFPIIIKMVGDQ